MDEECQLKERKTRPLFNRAVAMYTNVKGQRVVVRWLLTRESVDIRLCDGRAHLFVGSGAHENEESVVCCRECRPERLLMSRVGAGECSGSRCGGDVGLRCALQTSPLRLRSGSVEVVGMLDVAVRALRLDEVGE